MDVREKLNRLFHRGAEFSVSASPFNPVKLDLAIILVVAVLYVLVVMKAVADEGTQFVLLALYGAGASVYLVWRIRRVLAEHKR